MRTKVAKSEFLIWLRQPSVRTGQIVVAAASITEAGKLALKNLGEVDWDESEVDEVMVDDICRLDAFGDVDKQHIYDIARARGYTLEE